MTQNHAGQSAVLFRLVGTLVLALVAAAMDSLTMAVEKSNETTRQTTLDQELTNQIDVLPFHKVHEQEKMDAGALYLPSRVISPISPVVVRQDDPTGPKYQEAPGYTFLINNVKFPGLAQMDDGRLVLALTGVLDPSDKRVGLILVSDDQGLSWSQPQRLPTQRVTPVNLGGDGLMLWQGSQLWFSDDAGKSWGDPRPIPALPDGGKCHSDVAYHPLVEGNTVTFAFWTPVYPGYSHFHDGELFTQAVVRRHHVDSDTWDEPVRLPPDWALNEGSLLRARNGNLVGAFRTQMLGVPIDNDHWMGMATSVSKDNGTTWSAPARHFHYGRVHCSLLHLPEERILMTYAVRIGQLDGHVYHGIEAVVSHDHGATWDWPRRYILARWPNSTMHSPRSALLSDGRILTIYMNDTFSSWTEDGRPPTRGGINLYRGNVSAVIWRR